MSTPQAKLSGADNVNKTRETQKKNSPRTETRLMGLPPLPRLVDVIGAKKLGSWCGLSLRPVSQRKSFTAYIIRRIPRIISPFYNLSTNENNICYQNNIMHWSLQWHCGNIKLRWPHSIVMKHALQVVRFEMRWKSFICLPYAAYTKCILCSV